MHWFHLNAVVVASVVISVLALLAVAAVALFLLYWTRRKRNETRSTSDKSVLISASLTSPDTSVGSKSITADRKPSAEDTREASLDLEDENSESNIESDTTNREDINPPHVVKAGVGTLRQVSLSILYDLLLSLTHVRLKMSPRNSPTKTGHTTSPNFTEQPETNSNMETSFQRVPISPSHHLNSSMQAYEFQESVLKDLLRQESMVKIPVVSPTSIPDLVEVDPVPDKLNCEMPVVMSEAEMTRMLRDYVTKQLDYIFADDNRRHETYRSILEAMVSAPTPQLMVDAIYRIFRVTHGVLQQWSVKEGSMDGIDPTDTKGEVSLKVDFTSNHVAVMWDGPSHESDLLQFVSGLIQTLREEVRQPTYAEYIAVHLALCHLSRGHRISNLPIKFLGSPGFTSTSGPLVSLTDPGRGHMVTTSRFRELLDGSVVNVERHHGEHTSTADMIDEKVPPLLNFAQVRLHVGSAAPTSYFIGKALKDDFEEDFEKDVNMTACAAINAFTNGAAECKVCVCGLKSTQALRFLRTLRLKVQRRPNQHLTAVWNLNRTIIDDREGQIECSSRFEVAKVALEVTSKSGFDTIAFCGTTKENPCQDIVTQMTFEEAVSFTHEAHSCGLRVQFSTGPSPKEVTGAVLSGADTISVGKTRVLRNKSDTTSQEITSVLKIRDEAARSIRGKGVNLLSRLDTMFFEGSINENQNLERLQLFKALHAKSERDIKRSMKTLEDVLALTPCHIHIEGTARRLLASSDPLLQEVADHKWADFLKRLCQVLESRDTEALLEEYRGEPWLGYRRSFLAKHGIVTGKE